MSKKATEFAMWMNSGNLNISLTNINSVPWGTVELKPDKPVKKAGDGVRPSGLYEEGTVDEAGTSNRLRWRVCQKMLEN